VVRARWNQNLLTKTHYLENSKLQWNVRRKQVSPFLMDEDEDVLDLFADDHDLLFTNDCDKVNGENYSSKQEQTSETKPQTKPVDEATALAELPNYIPIEKDKSGCLEGDELEAKDDANITDNMYARSKIDISLDEVIQSGQKREDRKRPRLNSGFQEMHNTRNCKQRYMFRNEVQLCLQPRHNIAEMSPQDAGNELARCLDEVSSMLAM